MKNITTYTIAMVLFLLAGCNKEQAPRDEHWGGLAANINGKNWYSLAFAGINYNDGKLYINSDTYSKEGFLRESLLIYKIPLQVGQYRIWKTGRSDYNDKTGALFITSVDDGDVGGDFYFVMESDTLSSVTITKIDEKEVWGVFNLTLIRDTTSAVQYGAPDTLIMKNGEFHTKILN